MKIHQKFSIPVACLVFGLIGIALGATNRRDGALGSFAHGLVVIFLYYVPMYLGPALTKGGLIAAVAGGLAAQHRPRRGGPPAVPRGAAGRPTGRCGSRCPGGAAPPPARPGRRAPAGSVAAASTGPVRLLDRYVASAYIRVFGLATLGLAGIFYISTFLDLSDKVFKGDATWAMLGTYFVYITPQYAYYILPLAVLLAALVTVGVLTKNNELVVMKACGISLYRVAVPMLVCAAATGALLFALEESILGPANRRAERLRSIIRSGVASTFVSTRQWIAGERGEIYNYTYADPATRALLQVSIFSLNEDRSRLVARTVADRAVPRGADTDHWTLEHGWRRDFRADGAAAQFAAFETRTGRMAQPSVFVADEPDARFMGYRQLRVYADRLRASGLDVLGPGGGARAQAVVPVRDDHHDAHRRAVRGPDRPPRCDGGHRRRHRPGDDLLDHDQRLRRDGRRRHDAADHRRLGAKRDLRRRRRLSPALGPNLSCGRDACRRAAAQRHVVEPDLPALSQRRVHAVDHEEDRPDRTGRQLRCRVRPAGNRGMAARTRRRVSSRKTDRVHRWPAVASRARSCAETRIGTRRTRFEQQRVGARRRGGRPAAPAPRTGCRRGCRRARTAGSAGYRRPPSPPTRGRRLARCVRSSSRPPLRPCRAARAAPATPLAPARTTAVAGSGPT